MSDKFNACEDLGGHQLIVNADMDTDIIKFSGHIYCEWCGATTEDFRSEMFIEDEFGDSESIGNILADEEMEDRIDRDNHRIREDYNE